MRNIDRWCKDKPEYVQYVVKSFIVNIRMLHNASQEMRILGWEEIPDGFTASKWCDFYRLLKV